MTDPSKIQTIAAETLNRLKAEHPGDCTDIFFALVQNIMGRALYGNADNPQAVAAWIDATNEGYRRSAKDHGRVPYKLVQEPTH